MANAKNAPKTPESFESAMRELEQLIAAMENGQMPLEASLQAYQRGAFLVKFCQAQLQAVQEQVKIVEADMVRPLDLNE
ncbi:MAG: xseB [Burkholderiaceae bacterium]|nr:xseB [Burkholderiaceae bacterium]